MGVIYLLVVLQYFFRPAPWDGPLTSIATGLVGAAAWLGWLWFRKHPPTPQTAHPAMFTLMTMMALQNGIVLYLIGDPIHTTNQIFTALAGAFFFTGRVWFYSILTVIALFWLPAALNNDLQTVDWQQWSRLLLVGYTLSITLFEARRRSVLRIYALRFEAEDALEAAESANDERLSMERMMHAAQRRESLGVLAGGIAHDFNNLLTVIQGNTELAQREVTDNPLITDLLDEVDAASQRAAELTQMMLVHAGRSRPKQERVHLGQRLQKTKRLLESSLPMGTTITLVGSDDGPILEADGTLLDQVALNLLQNSVEACEQRGGRITVTWGNLALSEADIAQAWFSTPPEPGEVCYFEVADDGIGMNKETRGRMLEPFFTTKSTGSGLGLAAVQGILDSHKAGIWVSSAANFGTTIRVLLP